MRLDQGSFVAVKDIQRSAWPRIDLDEVIAVRVADEVRAAKPDKAGAERQVGKPAAYPCRVAPVKAPQAHCAAVSIRRIRSRRQPLPAEADDARRPAVADEKGRDAAAVNKALEVAACRRGL